jgi:hypothetical protein
MAVEYAARRVLSGGVKFVRREDAAGFKASEFQGFKDPTILSRKKK